MQDAVAIVTGGGTGIGAAVVRRLAGRGVRCVVNYAHSRDEAEALAAEVGTGAVAVQADIIDDAQCRALVAAAAWGEPKREAMLGALHTGRLNAIFTDEDTAAWLLDRTG